jgi:hypothetical protein
MSEQMRVWMEVIFNITYLVVVWTLVILMIVRRNRVDPENRALATRFTWAVALLALGDSGHVGFRVIAYLLGGLEANPVLVGVGAFSTAFTVTIFYMLMVDIWRLRFRKPLGFFGWFLLAAGVVRLIILLFPQNAWGQVIAPYNWSLLRNSLLVIQGVGVTFLILRDAIRAHDRALVYFLRPGNSLGSMGSPVGYAHDPQDLRLSGCGFHCLLRALSSEEIKSFESGG